MRTALPDRARAWAQSFSAETILEAIPVGGGLTDTKWLLQPADGDPLVLRWSDPVVWGATGAEHVRREADACTLLAGSGLPAPRLVASDPDGSVSGGPAALLTWRPGRVRLDPLGPVAVGAWAGLAVSVHRQRVPANRRPLFSFRGPAEPEIPGWARRPDLWRRAIDVWAAGPPPTPYGLLHRDFHLGNTLWQGDRVSGLVDWAETSWGPAELDVAHACSDFAMLHTVADAVAFRRAYVREGGRDADTGFWQVADILGFLPDPAHILGGTGGTRPDLTPEIVRNGLEDLLAITLG